MRVLDATDEQFDTFVREAGVKIKVSEEGDKWSFENRCRVINFARKRRLHLPFVDVPGIVLENEKRSGEEQKTISDGLREVAPQQAMIDIPGAPILSGWANIVMETMKVRGE